MTKITKSGLTLTLEVTVIADESNVAATDVDLFLKADGTPLDYTSEQESESLPALANGVQRVNISHTVAADGHYHFTVRSKSAAGSLSLGYTERYIHLSDDAPGGASNLDVIVIRGTQAD